MSDPYKILGVSPTASDDDIKKAYRALVKKYHPDKYRDSDLADLAEEKMKEINSAYEEIQKMRAGAQNNNRSYGTSGGEGIYREIRRLINGGYFDEAEARLNSVSVGDRNAEWHFLMGCVLMRKGSYVDAGNCFNTACGMDPYNREYRNARDNLKNRTENYGTGYNTQSRGCSGCDVCSSLICADCCCECMGGDLIRCC